MTLSPREKNIAIGVGAAIVLYGLYSVVIKPYMDNLDALHDKTQAAQSALEDQKMLFQRKDDLQKVWSDLTHGGLSDNQSAAESQAVRAILDWAGDAGVTVTALKPDRASDENKFQILSYHVTAVGRTPDVGRLMWDIETATIPVRLTDVQVTPRKEGTDDLTIQFGVTTLVQPPEPTKPAAMPAAVSDTNITPDVRSLS